MIKSLIQFSLPVVVARLANILLNLGASIIIGFSGITALAAYGLASPIFLMLYLISIAYLLIFSVKASKLKEEINRFSDMISASLLFALLMALALMLIFLIFPPILSLLGQAPRVTQHAKWFFYVIIAGVPALMLSVVLNQLLIILEHKKTVTLISFLQLLVGLSLMVLFVHHYHLGLAGAALALVISYWFKLIIFILYLHQKARHQMRFKKVSWSTFKEDAGYLLRLGWPVSLQYGSELLIASLGTLMIGHLYDHALAAQQISAQVRAFGMMLPFALGQACVILMGKHQRQSTSTLSTAWLFLLLRKSTGLGFIIMATVLLLINSFALPFIKLFIHPATPRILHIAREFLWITSLILICDTARYQCMAILRGLENTKTPMKISFFVYLTVGLLLAYFLGYHTTMNVIGVRVGLCIGLVLSTIVLAIYALRFIKNR